jgi:hypothetical protein
MIFICYPEGHPSHCVLCLKREQKRLAKDEADKNNYNIIELNCPEANNEFQKENQNSQPVLSSDAIVSERRTNEGSTGKAKE